MKDGLRQQTCRVFFKENLQLHNSPPLPSTPLPLLAGVQGYHPGKFLELEVLVGEF